MMTQSIPKKFTVGFAIAFIAVMVNALISYYNTNQLVENERRVVHTLQVLTELESTLSTLKDAEIGQRGYVLTGDGAYLQPHQKAIASIDEQIASLKQLTADNPNQQHRLATLERQATNRLNAIQQTITLRQTQGLEASQQAIVSGQGKQMMDEIRQLVAAMKGAEEALLERRVKETQISIQRTTITFTLALLSSLGLLSLLYYFIRHDFAARQQAADALQERENYLRAILDAEPECVKVVAADGTLLQINPAGLSMIAAPSVEAVVGQSVYPLVVPEHRDAFQALNERVCRGNRETLQFEITNCHGERRWLETHAVPMQNKADGTLVQLAVTQDITERKQAEALLRQAKNDLEVRVAERTVELLQVNQQLQQELDERKQIQTALQLSQARFAGILEIASDAIISIDANQTITLFNQGAEKIFGYKAEEVIGQPLDLLLPARAAALHRQHVSGFAQSDGKARRMGERSEILGRRKDGSEFPAEASISRLKLDSDTIFTAILRDISDRKQTELALSQQAAIIESSGDAIISVDLAGTIVSWNISAERLYGYTSAEAIGDSIRLIIPTHCLGEEEQFLQAIQQGGQIQYIETTRQRKDGTLVELGLSFSPVRDAANHIIGISAIARDITERKQVDRMKDEFVSVVSHELRTPLTSIHGSLGMLASGLLKPDSEQGERMLQIAVDSTDRLVRLINDILDIERIESGRVKMQKEFCQVDDLMTKAVNVVQTLADQAGVTLAVTNLSMQTWVDPDRIVQTLTNLLSNAVKFSSSGNTVWLTVQQQDNHVLFAVKDQGRGIPSDKLDSIFERFQQVDSSDSRNHEGTGLGLAICRSIVQQHGGQIWAESVLGKGSTFFFRLPIEDYSKPQLPIVQNRTARAPLVLICHSDREVFTRLKTTLFEQYGMEAVHATTGQEAIRLSQQLNPDLLILDRVLPEEDGFTVVEWLRQQHRLCRMPLVVYSAKDLDASERERLRLGQTEFLVKGQVSIEEFEQRVMALLQQVTQTE
jgi:PAS domain S-box-containing protein